MIQIETRRSLLILIIAVIVLSPSFSTAQESEPRTAAEFMRRAIERFRRAEMRGSVEDFDRVVEMAPERKAALWQRGIALYYAGDFAKGREQFEWHQTVNPDDVENAVWHFLCVARGDGFTRAREKLMPINGDERVPMKEIHQLFEGKASEDDVFRAARAGKNAEAVKEQLFYAYLYIGLFEEAQGREEASLACMRKAAGEFAQPHYMGDVARVHLKMRAPKKGEK